MPDPAPKSWLQSPGFRPETKKGSPHPPSSDLFTISFATSPGQTMRKRELNDTDRLRCIMGLNRLDQFRGWGRLGCWGPSTQTLHWWPPVPLWCSAFQAELHLTPWRFGFQMPGFWIDEPKIRIAMAVNRFRKVRSQDA